MWARRVVLNKWAADPRIPAMLFEGPGEGNFAACLVSPVSASFCCFHLFSADQYAVNTSYNSSEIGSVCHHLFSEFLWKISTVVSNEVKTN
jgi:hypothetical protein